MIHGNALVTGGNRGIGFNFVKQLASLPDVDLVFATCRSPDSAKDLQEFARNNPKVQILPLDVSNGDSIKSAAKAVQEKVGDKGLNLLINNAGIFRFAPKLEELTTELMVENYHTNTVAPLLVIQAFMPLLEKAAEIPPANVTDAKNAIVVNISSITGSFGAGADIHKTVLQYFGSGIPYFCSKVALNMVTMSVAEEKPTVTVISIHPGWVITDMGGPTGELTAEECAASVVQTLQTLKSEQTGSFLNWKGEIVPW